MASTVSFKACPCCAGTGIRPSARGSARIVASATPKDGERARRVDVFYLLNNPDPPWTNADLSPSDLPVAASGVDTKRVELVRERVRVEALL